jgi:hypothetical protein
VKEDNFEKGALLGKSELSSTAITCDPAPIPKRISVALGESAIILVGIVVLAYAPLSAEINEAMSRTADARPNFFLCCIKNSPKG